MEKGSLHQEDRRNKRVCLSPDYIFMKILKALIIYIYIKLHTALEHTVGIFSIKRFSGPLVFSLV